MFVKQMEVGQMAVFAYIVGCKETKEALVIDPASECERIFKEATDKGYTIKYILNTHSHIAVSYTHLTLPTIYSV